MAPAQRDEILASYLDALQAWATGECRRLWAQVDPADVKATFTPIVAPLILLNQVLAERALVAVDTYMVGVAADAGWRYDVRWTDDQPNRPNLTPRGQPIDQFVRRAPIVVLWRIKTGHPTDAAMTFGLNYLMRCYGSQAHQIGRDVIASRTG